MSTPVRIPTWVPSLRIARRGARPRLSMAQVELDAGIAEIPADAATPLFVHAGQGRCHAVPILSVAGDLHTILPHEGPDPIAAFAYKAFEDDRIHAALAGSPIRPRAVASDRRIPVERVTSSEAEAAAREALQRYLDDNVRLCAGRILVRIPGPFVHLNHDRARLVATLNPALAGLESTALPIFAPLADRAAFHARLVAAGAMAGLGRNSLSVDHLDQNGREPTDLMAMAAPAGAERGAAIATALLAPSHVAQAMKRFVAHAGAGLVEPIAPALARLSAADPFTRFGHFGGADPYEILLDAASCVDHGAMHRSDLMTHMDFTYRSHVAERVAPALAPPRIAADEADLAVMAI